MWGLGGQWLVRSLVVAVIAVVPMLGCAVYEPSAGGPPQDATVFVPREVTGFWSTIDLANGWVYLSNDGEGGPLVGNASIGDDLIGQYDVVVTVDGVRWTNASSDGGYHWLSGPSVLKHHSEVGTVSVAVSGGYGQQWICGKKAEERTRSVFACLPFSDYYAKEANWRAVFGGSLEPTGGMSTTTVELAPNVVIRVEPDESSVSKVDPSWKGAASSVCDSILKRKLVQEKGAFDGDRINAVVNEVQSRNSACRATSWDPKIVQADPDNGCWRVDSIGGATVPLGLMEESKEYVRSESGGANGDIIVHFGTMGAGVGEPRCWLYMASSEAWFGS